MFMIATEKHTFLKNTMSSEFFPPTEAELEEMIKSLEARLNDDSYQDEWTEINEQLKVKQQQLQDLIITNNLL